MGGRWASSRPLEVQFRGRSGGICGVRLSYFQPSPWSMNVALGCRGVLQACHTLWAHCRPFDVSLEGRWASLRPSKALFTGKCGDVWGGLLVDFWPSPWSLNDALVCRGVPQACHTLLARCGPFDTSLDGRWASPQPLEVRSKGTERRCL